MTDANRAAASTLANRLTDKARTLVLAHGETRRRSIAADPSKWRQPDLLWPLTTKG